MSDRDPLEIFLEIVLLGSEEYAILTSSEWLSLQDWIKDRPVVLSGLDVLGLEFGKIRIALLPKQEPS